MTVHTIDGIARTVLDSTLDLQAQYEGFASLEDRKKKGQFFTPPEVCRFMAGLLPLEPARRFCILDPGAGIGSISAAVCKRFLSLPPSRSLQIHLIENDPDILPFLGKVMQRCANALREHGHSMDYQIHPNDFILETTAAMFSQPTLFDNGRTLADFDAVIMNPPYYKVNKASAYSQVMQDIVHGQPNIYALFLAAGAQMLRPGGKLVAITPRSFCNGLYFRGFRRWFLNRMSLDHIHLFESRKETFRDVLQESVITASHRLGRPSSKVTVTTSRGLHPCSTKVMTLPTHAVIDNSCGHAVIRIPANDEDLAIASIIESWPKRFSDTGLQISTGPVVMFRASEYLLPRTDGESAAPLLSAFNVKPFRTDWPTASKKFPMALKVCAGSRRLLLPTQNYILLRRFSAKEERRRLTASPLLAADFAQPFLALENHLNYIYHAERELTPDEVTGVAALFNSSLLDRYFRTISGNTQVNATEIRFMKFPDLTLIARIGQQFRETASLDCGAVERTVLHVLNIEGKIAQHLLEGALFGQV